MAEQRTNIQVVTDIFPQIHEMAFTQNLKIYSMRLNNKAGQIKQHSRQLHSASKYTHREYQRCRFPTSHVCTLTPFTPHTQHKIATAVSCQGPNSIIESIPDLHSGHQVLQTLVLSMYVHPEHNTYLTQISPYPCYFHPCYKCSSKLCFFFYIFMTWCKFMFMPQSSKPFHSTCPNYLSRFLLNAMSPIPRCFLTCSFFQYPTTNDSYCFRFSSV